MRDRRFSSIRLEGYLVHGACSEVSLAVTHDHESSVQSFYFEDFLSPGSIK